MSGNEGGRRRPPSVLVVGREPALRAGLRALLVGEGICAVTDADLDALPLVLPPADVCVVAGVSEGLSDLMRELEGRPLVLITGNAAALRDLGDGPGATLPPEASAPAIAAAVRAVAAGLRVVDPAMPGAPRFAPDSPSEALVDAPADLTPREREILALVATGLPNKAIARELAISEHTVKYHVGQVLAKLGAASRTEAVVTAASRGLLAL